MTLMVLLLGVSWLVGVLIVAWLVSSRDLMVTQTLLLLVLLLVAVVVALLMASRQLIMGLLVTQALMRAFLMWLITRDLIGLMVLLVTQAKTLLGLRLLITLLLLVVTQTLLVTLLVLL